MNIRTLEVRPSYFTLDAKLLCFADFSPAIYELHTVDGRYVHNTLVCLLLPFESIVVLAADSNKRTILVLLQDGERGQVDVRVDRVGCVRLLLEVASCEGVIEVWLE